MLRLTRGFTKGYGIPKLFPSVIPTEAGATKGRGPQRARFLAGWGGGSDGEWRDPDTLSRTMLYQGVLTRTCPLTPSRAAHTLRSAAYKLIQ